MKSQDRSHPGRRDELTVFEVLYVLWGRKKLVGVIVIVLAIASLVFGLTRERVYTAESFVSVAPYDQSLGRFEREALIRGVVDPFVSGDVIEEAVTETGWTGNTGEFRDRLELEYVVREDGPTGILVRFSSRSPEQGAEAANAFAGLLAQRIEESAGEGVSGGRASVEVEIVTRADASELWGGGRILWYLAGATLVGIVLGGALALLFEGRTRNWRDAQDAEMTLHAPVLGVIPDYPSLVEKEDAKLDEDIAERHYR